MPPKIHVVAGWVLTGSPWQTREWARLRFPDEEFSENLDKLMYSIPRAFKKAGFPPIFETVYHPSYPGEEEVCMFVSQHRVTHTETPSNYRWHAVTPNSEMFRERLFGGYEQRLPFLKDIVFFTVADPCGEVCAG
ncbi:hypothetical protein PLICRDRAFT_177125 [Plicaturopsis crispa FD-325 SS-3]|nr:hypothetical protein PLICRDRAFT_177125 [Plicaturopsis crispa FD-325 SS-3]